MKVTDEQMYSVIDLFNTLVLLRVLSHGHEMEFTTIDDRYYTVTVVPVRSK
jgi:hypothetical protein